jgi:hypothetical protein
MYHTQPWQCHEVLEFMHELLPDGLTEVYTTRFNDKIEVMRNIALGCTVNPLWHKGDIVKATKKMFIDVIALAQGSLDDLNRRFPNV